MASIRRDRTARLRDPLSVGFEAHRGLLILRLRWHERAARRAETAILDEPEPGEHPGGPADSAEVHRRRGLRHTLTGGGEQRHRRQHPGG